MAQYLKIARTTYSSYEQGRRIPDIDTQNKIADYFGVSLDYLHGRKSRSEIMENSLTPNQINVANYIDDSLTKLQIDNIIEFIEFIKNKNTKKD